MKTFVSCLAGMLLLSIICVIFQQQIIQKNRATIVALTSKIELQNNSIAQFKKEQDAYQSRIKYLHDELSIKKRKALSEAEKLEGIKAPIECLESIRWGAEQGVKLNAFY